MIIRLAEKRIEIHNLFPYLEEYCKDYRADGIPEFSVRVTPEDILRERQKSEREDLREKRAVRRFSDAYLETLAVYRKIARCLLDRDILLFHGSAIAVDGTGYLFTAKSGTGKSTQARLWRAYFGERAQMINDDKPLLHVSDCGVTVYGTPWDGKHRLNTNTSVPLRAICVVKRAAENRIERADRHRIYPLLVQQTNRPEDAAGMAQTLLLLDRLIARIPIFILHCNMEPDAAVTAYTGMQKAFAASEDIQKGGKT